MIYRAHPDVGAILHVHAWMEGIAATDVNYPCGTQELAEAVAELIAREPDPAHAVIGLRNHGITATGDTLTEILDRIQADILRQVPMTSGKARWKSVSRLPDVFCALRAILKLEPTVPGDLPLGN